MQDISHIIDELSWAVSSETPDEAALATILQALKQLATFPSGDLPPELEAALAEVTILAGEAEEDPARSNALVALLRGTLEGSSAAPVAPTDSEEELLSVFLSASGEALGDLERLLLAMEEADDDDALEEVKRSIHTLKGECGILSLHVAQDLWHDAESMIDSALDAGVTVPVDPLMGALDWHRGYLELLTQDPEASPPETASVLAPLIAWEQGEPLAPADQGASDASSSAAVDETDTLVVFSDQLLKDETVPEFITESQAHLEDSEAALFELEEDPTNAESIARIFRAFHTIKGVAGFLEIDQVSRIAHSAETLLDKFRQSDISFGRAHADVVLEAKDMIASLLEALAGRPGPSVNALEHLIVRTEEMAADPASAVRLGPQAVKAVLDQAGISGDGSSERAAGPTTAKLGTILLERGLIEKATLDAALEQQRATKSGEERLKLGELLVRLGAVTEAQVEDVLRLQGRGSALGQVLESRPQKDTSEEEVKRPQRRAKASGDTTIRVNTQRLDALVDMVGELVIAQQMVVQDAARVMSSADERLVRDLGHLGKITRDLQESSMSLRMVTFKSTFQKMHRLVRDVAAKANKDVKLQIEGADTEVDRNVVDKISDPLVHLVRNAIDHGLETTDERVAAGKSRRGNVVLSAHHQSGAIVISLQDDGRGLARDRIIAKALERGLISPGTDTSELSDAAVNRLIFEPGFSTAQAVTDISGRGVGMDVVRRNIEAMRGRIEIVSREGHGTTFQIYLPLTLAIIDAMVVRAGNDRFVIPTLSIVQSFQPAEGELHTIRGDSPLVEVRGDLVPMCPLASAVGKWGEPTFAVGKSTAILVEAMGRRACLVVDEILGQQQVVIKKLGDCVPALPAISGGAILGDGRVALIVDVEGILAQVDTTIPA